MSDFVEHKFEPIYDSNSKVLILGTIPSPKSRLYGFYYSHPQNRFWKIMSGIFCQPLPCTKQQKIDFLYKNKIAMWDVLKSCDIKGADDSSIKNPVVNDIQIILSHANIKVIFTTGKKATDIYRKYCYISTGIESIYLPSTSPANCRHYSYQDLLDEYRIILSYIE